MHKELLHAAMGYHRYGLIVVPGAIPIIKDDRIVCSCGEDHKPGKHPLVSWRRFQRERPLLNQITTWWDGRFSGYNICAIHGDYSKTVLLDWDGAEGRASRYRLQQELGKLPEAPTVLTPGGGYHELYRHPGRYVPTVAGIREGFDVRGDGGVSVMPPSLHESGSRYEWEADMSLDDLAIPDLPLAWIDFVSGHHRSTAGSVDTSVVWEQADDGRKLVTEGRETYMRDVVWEARNRLYQLHGRMPTVQELYDAAGEIYFANADQKKPGRGADELAAKCQAAVRKTDRPRGLTKPFLKRI